jgi:NTE family protein
VLPAVDWGGRLLVDGGVVDNTPISQAVALGARQVYVLPTGGPCALTSPPRGALATLVYATGLMVAQRFTAEVASPAAGVNLVDFGHAEALMTRAAADARAFLDGRANTVVPLRRSARRRRAESRPLAELPPAS